MKQNIRHRVILLLILVLLIAGAFLSMVVADASEYCTIRVDYLFENGKTAYDSYVAVVEKGQPVDITVTNPSISGYNPVDSLDDTTAQPAPTTHIEYGELTEDLTMKVYYVPDIVPYKVKYFM